MFDLLGLYLVIFLLGAVATLFSVLSWRMKNQIFFLLGITFSALLLIYFLYNSEYLIYLLLNTQTSFNAVVLILCLVIPITFLIASRIKKGKLQHDSDVTDEFLNEIINSKDEEDNFN